MLEKLTETLVAEDNAKGYRDVMVESIILSSNSGLLQRMSHIDTNMDCSDLKATLESTELPLNASVDECKKVLISACK